MRSLNPNFQCYSINFEPTNFSVLPTHETSLLPYIRTLNPNSCIFDVKLIHYVFPTCRRHTRQLGSRPWRRRLQPRNKRPRVCTGSSGINRCVLNTVVNSRAHIHKGACSQCSAQKCNISTKHNIL